jgi:chemotaxis protein MotA
MTICDGENKQYENNITINASFITEATNMELSTILGLGSAIAAIVLTVIIEGGSFISFVNPGALLLILGGSMATGMISFGIKQIVLLPKYFLLTIFPRNIDFSDLVVTFVSYSEKARREGLLSLEEDLKEMTDEVMQLGFQMVIDGTDPEIVRNIMDNLSTSLEDDEKIPANFFETIGGFSPTLGIIGTVMGLVHVLENLGNGSNIESLGRGIAVAFIATFYGISFANLLWLPLSNKMRFLNKKYNERREIIKAGVLAIQNGDNPRVVKEKLVSIISDADLRKEISNIADEEGTPS